MSFFFCRYHLLDYYERNKKNEKSKSRITRSLQMSLQDLV